MKNRVKLGKFKISPNSSSSFVGHLQLFPPMRLYSSLALFLLFLSCTSAFSQTTKVTLSGLVIAANDKVAISFATVTLHKEPDSSFVSGTMTNEEGRFTLSDVSNGAYFLQIAYVGYASRSQQVFVGKLSPFLDLGTIELLEIEVTTGEVTITARQDDINSKMDKKTFSIENNVSQAGGSALDAMRNLPGVTIQQDATVQLRGNNRVSILIDGKQTALTGFGNQAGLDNIPASAIDRVEIINNPSARHDANGNAGIINIILKKEKKLGFNGKVGASFGLGALWKKQTNLPDIPPQYQYTPKVNPTFSFNYRREKFNLFFQGDFLWQQRLNKNEFLKRTYADGTIIHQQYQENRTQNFPTAKLGVDWYINERNTFTVSTLYSREEHIDRGSLPYYNSDFSVRNRLWTFTENEVNSTVGVSTIFEHKFKQPGHLLNVSLNYNFQQEDERFWMTNTTPDYVGQDSFKLLANQHVIDMNVEYIRPLKHGHIEGGAKFRWRSLPVNMLFKPGLNSPIDVRAGGWANYSEIIPALFANYVLELKHIELEVGLRMEYVQVKYDVIPTHNTYKSDAYWYFQPFPNLRFAYVINDKHRLTFFYNRRVDRPDEGDVRIFPKYDDPEILKVGNPAIRPQYTQNFELGYKTTWKSGSFNASAYYKIITNNLTRIATIVPNNTIIYSIMQNAGNTHNVGIEAFLVQDVTKWLTFNLALNGYYNIISAFNIENKYPFMVSFRSAQASNYSGNIKFNAIFNLPKQFYIQLTAIYLAPDIIPQGKIDSRFSLDFGIKKTIQKGRGELYLNATDIAATMRIRKQTQGNGFQIISTDFYETQALRLGYSYKF